MHAASVRSMRPLARLCVARKMSAAPADGPPAWNSSAPPRSEEEEKKIKMMIEIQKKITKIDIDNFIKEDDRNKVN